MPWVKRIATTAIVSSNIYRIMLTGVLIATLLRKLLRRG